MAALKKRRSAGVDNIPADLVQADGETIIEVLKEIVLENRRMDSVADYYTSQEGQFTVLPDLQNLYPHQSLEQSVGENHLQKA